MVLLRKKKMQLHGQTMGSRRSPQHNLLHCRDGPHVRRHWRRQLRRHHGHSRHGTCRHGWTRISGQLPFSGLMVFSASILQANAPRFLRCYGQKIPMWATLTLWVVSLVLGIVLFFMVNTSLLGNFPSSFGD